MADLNPAQQAMMEKARNTTSKTVGLGGTDEAPPPSPITPGTVQGIDEWGPYLEHTIVTTPHGQYGVDAGQILYFEPEQWFSRRENRMVTTMKRRYKPAKPVPAA